MASDVNVRLSLGEILDQVDDDDIIDYLIERDADPVMLDKIGRDAAMEHFDLVEKGDTEEK